VAVDVRDHAVPLVGHDAAAARVRLDRYAVAWK
jgi:hypothetical protein